jgi:hypothetical protein
VAGGVSDSPWQRFARAIGALPLWGRWVITIAGYAIVIGVIVFLVSGGSSSGVSTQSEVKAEAQANREADLVIEEEQAPRVAPLSSHTAVPAALMAAITKDVNARIAASQLTGPLQHVRCAPSGASHAGRAPFRCTVTTANIVYPFDAIAELRARQLTWCKVEPPPTTGSGEVPVSPRCLP